MMDQTTKHHSELYDRIRKEIGRISVVDAHEHLPYEEMWVSAEADPRTSLGTRLSMEPDFSSLLGYAIGDLVSAGMATDAVLPGMSWGQAMVWARRAGIRTGVSCTRATLPAGKSRGRS